MTKISSKLESCCIKPLHLRIKHLVNTTHKFLNKINRPQVPQRSLPSVLVLSLSFHDLGASLHQKGARKKPTSSEEVCTLTWFECFRQLICPCAREICKCQSGQKCFPAQCNFIMHCLVQTGTVLPQRKIRAFVPGRSNFELIFRSR